jgi:phage terminase large subunit
MLKKAGFAVKVIPNQGPGAAKQRIEALKRRFPQMVYHRSRTQAGREALGWYHERKDDRREIGLGPEHDWSSHGADAAGLLAVDYKEPTVVSRDGARKTVKGIV